MFQFVLNTPLEDHKSSNVNEVIRAVLNSLYFFTKRFRTHQKHKSINTQSSKSTKRYKRTKIQNALKKHLRGRKSLICLFAFLCFLCARRKENRKKKIEKTEKSHNVDVLNSDGPTTRYTYAYINLVVGTRT